MVNEYSERVEIQLKFGFKRRGKFFCLVLFLAYLFYCMAMLLFDGPYNIFCFGLDFLGSILWDIDHGALWEWFRLSWTSIVSLLVLPLAIAGCLHHVLYKRFKCGFCKEKKELAVFLWKEMKKCGRCELVHVIDWESN